MQLTNNRLALLETENDLRLASQQLDILLGLDETLLICPDTTLLSKTYQLDNYADYIDRAYTGDRYALEETTDRFGTQQHPCHPCGANALTVALCSQHTGTPCVSHAG